MVHTALLFKAKPKTGPARPNLKTSPAGLVQILKAKFHYAILVADRSVAGRRPEASWNLAYLRQVCDQDSVMEFGFEPVCNQVRAMSTCRI